MMSKFAYTLFLCTFSSITLAQSWQCRNASAEISCDQKTCDINQDGFTPFDISTNGKNELSVCAYTGCWDGKAKVFQSKNYLIVVSHYLQWSHNAKPSPTAFILNIDTKSKLGFIQGEGFAMPVHCTIT